ncbi:hypothetical protein ATE84_3337 [Aquimarina sp. MAR_2010_214]|uniref:hypothetical protein n=1 Tax=Aquimarina sp. MAR_2010_214 TaxID=1250026 RepID=UPI000CC3239A|nr:hypothetical protein [Aquimarina sp. MAR_2010_214]PKV51263.1 hypothetical protein ATE84_3337 [Aquimarina sp. MAR_2010_214]
MNTYPEHKLVKKCLLEIEEKLKWGNSDQWHNDVFIELSESIQQNTGILLSPTTLKRVWGKVNYKSAPSISTLNTLSQFAGYANWRDYKNKNDTKKPSWIEKKVAQNIGVIVISAAIMTIVFISFYSMIGTRKDKADDIDLSKITFTSRPITQGLPNSVVFDFNLNTIKSDSIYIQQFWDVTKTIKIRPGQKKATGIYYFPGYFGAKLLVDGQVIKEHDLFITSNNWMSTIDYKPIPKYVPNTDLLRDRLSFSNTIFNEIKSTTEPVTSTFHLVKDFGDVSGDNIRIKTSVRNVYREKWAVCQKLRIVILGTNGALIVPFSIPGCVSDINVMLNDVYLRGKEHDLSAFGVDFSDFRAIDINIKEKKVVVFIGDKEIYSRQYNKSIGKFVGIRYRFLGAGEVSYLNITEGLDEKNIINHDFSATK